MTATGAGLAEALSVFASGVTLVTIADGRDDVSAQPLRFPVQYVIRPQTPGEYLDYRGYTGTVASGTVSVGDKVIVLPTGRRTEVSGIDRAVVGGILRRGLRPEGGGEKKPRQQSGESHCDLREGTNL